MFFFCCVKDKIKKRVGDFKTSLRESCKELWKSVKKIHTYRGLIPFLLASLSYSNAITAAVIFLYLYAREEINLGVQQFMGVFITLAISASIGSWVAGKIVDKYGAKWTLIGSGLIWILVTIILLFPRNYYTFFISGAIGGAAMGAIWTANRPMLIGLAPSLRIGQFFGFTELTDKFSGVFGPIIFGYLVVVSGYTVALTSLIVFFTIGVLLLLKVPDIRF